MSNKKTLPVDIVDEYNGGLSTRELAKKYNCDKSVVSRCLKEYGVIVKNKKNYSDEQKEWLKNNVKNCSFQEITKNFNDIFGTNKTVKQINSLATSLGLVNEIDSSFKKGSSPFNKGKTWDEWMSKEGQEKVKQFAFSSKDRSKNNADFIVKPIGSERLHDGYIKVKIKNNNGSKNYEFKHILVWEEKYGPVPDDSCIVFADGNKKNCDINNLILVKKSELCCMNKNGFIYKGNADATKVGHTMAKLKLKIGEVQKNAKR